MFLRKLFGASAAVVLLLFGMAAKPALPSADWLKNETLTTISGQDFDFLKPARGGKSLVLVFWTPWCGKCAREAPDLVKAAAELKSKADFVGVVPGSDEMIQARKVDGFIKKHGLSYPSLRDRELRLTKRLNIQGTPTIVVIDPEMNIRYHDHKLPASWTSVL